MSATNYEVANEEFFKQLHGPSVAEAVPPRFGLIDDTDHRWANVTFKLAKLNKEAPAGVSYKLIFLGRHGEGYHNVAEALYGTKKWEDDWSRKNGNTEEGGDLVWGPDANLTPEGEQQALDAHARWVEELRFGIPLPSKQYCSPLTRAIRTHLLTYEGIINEDGIKKTMILEKCREEYGEHTCDKRRTRTEIHTAFPQFSVEELTEDDLSWEADVRETKAHVAKRARSILDKIFTVDVDDTVVSITSHSGFINGLLRVLEREYYPLPTGGVLPVVVKATKA